MTERTADGRAESVQDDLANNEKEDAKDDVSDRPPILQGAGYEEELESQIDKQLDGIQEVQDHEKADSVGRPQAGPRFKGGEGDQEGYSEGDG